ncbi:hypothetical protein PIB30_033648 [Stylosanthes scabra]|uniref:Uncharacterized protein n=1 Tax=Stylosanthes scabra TaxID=79078 RepID=A0ABU6TDA5_9FABA|nr:hypothetical protein [Stylosanthes scabra]
MRKIHRLSPFIRVNGRILSLSPNSLNSRSWIFCRFPTLKPYELDTFEWPLASRWGRYLPTSDEKVPQVLHHRKQLDLIPFLCLSPVSDGCGTGRSRSFHPAGRPQGPLDFDRPTYILRDYRVAPGGSGDPAVWRGSKSSHMPLNIDFMHAKDGRGVISGFLRSISAGMVCGHPGLPSFLALHSQMIRALYNLPSVVVPRR